MAPDDSMAFGDGPSATVAAAAAAAAQNAITPEDFGHGRPPPCLPLLPLLASQNQVITCRENPDVIQRISYLHLTHPTAMGLSFSFLLLVKTINNKNNCDPDA